MHTLHSPEIETDLHFNDKTFSLTHATSAQPSPPPPPYSPLTPSNQHLPASAYTLLIKLSLVDISG
jgi:hypothetical protein